MKQGSAIILKCLLPISEAGLKLLQTATSPVPVVWLFAWHCFATLSDTLPIIRVPVSPIA